jgi:hypothetical protein
MGPDPKKDERKPGGEAVEKTAKKEAPEAKADISASLRDRDVASDRDAENDNARDVDRSKDNLKRI